MKCEEGVVRRAGGSGQTLWSAYKKQRNTQREMNETIVNQIKEK